MRAYLIISLTDSPLGRSQRVDTVASTLADHDLLFEALALHLGYVTMSEIGPAVNVHAARDQTAAPRSLARELVERGLLDADRAAVLERLADELLTRHSGNVRHCLDGLAAFGSLRHDLEGKLVGLESRHPTSPPMRSSNGARVQSGHRDDPLGPPQESAPTSTSSQFDDDEDDDEEDENRGTDDHVDFALNTVSEAAVGSRFQVMHAHAKGGIGVVSVAFDSELQREVALKQIKPESADDPDSRARFLLEAEVTGRLEHPGIVPVYGLGFDGQGRPYYAMRFVRGITLEEAIAKFHSPASSARPALAARERVLELRRLLGRFVNVCHTMAYAHSRGVLHRDLKPANILLGPYNETLIVDWGLAKVLGRGQASASPPEEPSDRKRAKPARILPPLGQSSSTDTVAGAAFGTPAFMSPEQAEGQLDQLGPTSDVYSLGAVLYTMLCGRPPFEYAWCEVTSLLAKVKNGEFLSPRQVKAGVPRPLEAICLKAMSRRSQDRYPGAEVLAADIERWLGDEPVAAYREPRWARMLRWGRRHRPLVASAAALLTTAVAALSLGLLLLGRAQRETEAQRERAVRQSTTATFMLGEANNRAEELSGRDYINRVNLAHREFLDDNAALGEQILYGCQSSLRNWEWSHVQRLSHLELDSFVNDAGPQPYDVWSLAFSPDGRRLASGSGPWYQAHSGATASLIVRELDTGRVVFAHRGWPGAVQAVAFSPDGRRVIAGTGTTDNVVKGVLTCHKARTGEIVWKAEEPEVNILGLAYAPDGKTIASACGGFNNYDGIGFVRLRDAATGKIAGQIPAGPGGAASVAYSPDGAQLAIANRGLVDVWDASRHSLSFQLRGHREFIYAVTFSPDGQWIATGGWDRVIRLWDRKTGKLERTLTGHRGFVRGLSFRADGKQLLSCSEDKSLRLWDPATGRSLASFHGHLGFVHCASFSPDGARAASGSMDAAIKIWPAAAPDSQVTFRNGSGWSGTIAFHPSGNRVATAHNGGIRVWDPRSGEEFWRIVGPRGLLGRIVLAFTPDGKSLLASGPDGGIHQWDAESGRHLRILTPSAGAVVGSALNPAGTLLAGAGEDGIVRIWNVGDGTVHATLPGHAATVNAVAFSPDGLRLASASEDRQIKIWDVDSAREIATLSGHVTGVKGLAFAPDGRVLASVGGQYRGTPLSEVFLWDAGTGGLLRKLRGHTSLVTAVAFFPDGRRLATASDDRTIKLWNPRTGDDVFTLRGHTSGVVSLAISRDGRQIVTGGIDCTARVWTSESPSVDLDQIRKRAAVDLVQSLFETHMLKSEVLGALKGNSALENRLRVVALDVASRRAEDAQALYEAGWLMVVRPTGTQELNEQALARLEAACRLTEADPERRDEYRHVVALALYRVGRSDEALQLVARLGSESRSNRRGPRHLAIDLAVLAMANHRLGRFADAHAALDELRSLVYTADAPDQEAISFLREAEGLVHE